MTPWIFTYLLLGHATSTWAIAPGPETAAEASERRDLVDAAIAYEAHQEAAHSPFDAKTLAATARVVWQEESALSVRVHMGELGRWGSDRGRAKCLGQLHVSGIVPREQWERLAGTDPDSTRRCARATMRVLSAMGRYCRGDLRYRSGVRGGGVGSESGSEGTGSAGSALTAFAIRVPQ